MHLAIIMDGNGRWAQARGLPRLAGHRAGVKALERVVEAAPGLGVSTLTVYAFSSDNWKRPAGEVNGLMALLASYLEREPPRLAEKGVRLSFVGRRDRAPDAVRRGIASAESITANGARLHVRIAFDYSARDMLLTAARECAGMREDFAAALGRAQGGGEPAPDVDLLIRTGGEQRLSDFLLWECAYAELLFPRCMWPEFNEDALREALDWFRGRERRYGALPSVA